MTVRPSSAAWRGVGVVLWAVAGIGCAGGGGEGRGPAVATRPVGAEAVVVRGPATGASEGSGSVSDRYTKRSVRIPMRDGVELYTTIYEPRDRAVAYPMLMTRTPYTVAPYAEGKFRNWVGMEKMLAEEGFIFVYQDVRGRHLSGGVFTHATPHVEGKKGPGDVDESTDTYDTIEWLLKHVENHNGRVGMHGISYPGFYSSAGMIDAHPALVAVSPQAPVGDFYFDDIFHHGAFMMAHILGFDYGFTHQATGEMGELRRGGGATTQAAVGGVGGGGGRPRFNFGTRDGYAYYLGLGSIHNMLERYGTDRTYEMVEAALAHPTHDAYWDARDITRHLKHVAPHVMVVGGWYDAEDLWGTFATYHAVEEGNPGVENVLVVGPWAHGAWAYAGKSSSTLGDFSFGKDVGTAFARDVMVPFFVRTLKEGKSAGLAEATVYETGTDVWRTFEQWPPKGAEGRVLMLGAGGRLEAVGPKVSSWASEAGAATRPAGSYTEYVSDPARPVPYSPLIGTGMGRTYMIDDQRFAGRRPDVVEFRTEVLKEDMVVAGKMEAELYVSTTGTDSDWVVKVIDEYPADAATPEAAFPGHQPAAGTEFGGYERMVRSEFVRGRYRESLKVPKAFVPGEVVKVTVPLQDVLHNFKAGHRLVVQIQSTCFPLIDRNPQTFVENVGYARPGDYVRATQRVYHDAGRPSALRVRVVPRE